MLSLLFTYGIRRYALQHLLDVPNQRSSHHLPTPRGGGLGIVLAFFSAVIFTVQKDWFGLDFLLLLSMSMLIAGIGFWDDHQHVAARWRFLVHLIAAMGALFFLQGLPPLSFGSLVIDLGLFGYILGVVYLVWMLNLFNFMDGIDGIAASEAVFVAAALAGFMFAVDVHLTFIAAALAVSSLGFLCWNWPPAKIFMGDVGSGFLGFVLGLLILLFSNQEPGFLYIGLILCAVFVVDASLTLITRFIRGEKWYAAHCSHAYQHAARKYGHLKVVLSIWAINLLWLLPLAYGASRIPEYGWVGVIIAYSPLLYAAIVFKAGRE